MTTAEQDIERFTQFARNRLRVGDSDASIDELFDLWRIENPSDDDGTAENVAAINAAIEDFRNGDRGRPAGELSRQLRQQYGMPTE